MAVSAPDSVFCPLPWWQNGRLSGCVIDEYLRALVPTSSGLVSIIVIFLYICGIGPRRRRSYGFEFLHYHTKVPPAIQVLEATAILADAALSIALLVRRDAGATIAAPLLSVYLFLLVVARSPSPDLRARLTSHSAALYSVQWLCTALVAPSAFTHGPEGFPRTAIAVRLGLFTALVLIHISAPRTLTPSSAALLTTDDEALPSSGPAQTASLLSRLVFAWIDGLLWKALRASPLEAADLYPLDGAKSSAIVVPLFHRQTATAASASLLWHLFIFLRRDLLRQGAWASLASVAVFVTPMLMRIILEKLEGSGAGAGRGTAWLCVGGMLVWSLVAGVADCQCAWTGSNLSARVRTVLLGRVYDKVLRRRMVRSPQATGDELGEGVEVVEKTKTSHATDGTILNFVSGDVDMVSTMSGALYLVWVNFPVQITVGTTLLYSVLGWAGVVGVVLMMALLPLNVRLSKRLAAVQGQVLSATDARIQASNELVRTARAIKYYAWEMPFRERVLEKRRAELKTLRRRFIWWSISMTVFYSLPFIATLLTFFVYTVVFGNDLRTSIAFPSLAIFAVLRIPLDRLVDSITFLIQAHVSLVRIGKFLQERESDKYAQLSEANSPALGFRDAHLRWPTTHSATEPTPVPSSISSEAASDVDTPANDTQPNGTFTLRNLNIDFHPGALNVICGPSGSGKSALLLALLGELSLQHGHILSPRPTPHAPPSSTAYCPHDPWLLNASIRANILLGHPLHPARYAAVLHAVALGPDLAALPGGDAAPAGEGGGRLSGGQRQRVALARALYSPARCVVLDDCLSAVDARTAREVFARGVRGEVMKGRTCVLATHLVRLVVPHAEFVVVLEGGRVKAQGGPREVMATGVLGVSTADDALFGEIADGDSPAPEERDQSAPSTAGQSADEADTFTGTKETKFEGAVSRSTVQGYLSAMGPKWVWALVLIGFAAQQVAALGTNLWIKEWAFQYDELEKDKSPKPETEGVTVSPWYYLAIYSGIWISYALLTFVRDIITFSGSLQASRKIYEQLLGAVLFAKLAFFDRPLGQITNRMSRDVSVIDQLLASFSVSALQIAASVATIAALMITFLPHPALVAAVLAAAFLSYYHVTALYMRGARDLKRIEAVARSPLYQLVGEALAGGVSIRSFGREGFFAGRHGAVVDEINRPYLLLAASKQWLTLRIGALSSVLTFATGAFVVWGAESIEAGAAGLVLTYAATFTENMLWFVQIYAIIQENLTSLERIVEYTSQEQEVVGDDDAEPSTAVETNHHAQQHQLAQHEQHQIPHDWPRRGHVRFHAFRARYAPHLPLVLKDISFEAAPGERVAVVGRTGAGKSSLVLALLRALEADADAAAAEGGSYIDIDGVNIASVPLHRLRGTAVTVVPQDAPLFDGSVRDNMDPLRQHTDAELTQVLQAMQPPQPAATNDNEPSRAPDETTPPPPLLLDLAQPAAELSRGQRQLLCVARGLLRRARVLVLDEATVSVDAGADAAVQAGLRAYAVATGATVVAIAHRLRTVADYDKVVVLDGGRVVEQGSVGELLRRGEGEFRRLCEESGDLEVIEGCCLRGAGGVN